MKTIRIVGLCLMAVFAFSAVAASSASADLLFVPQKGTFPFLATSLLTEVSKLETTGGSKIECTVSHIDVQVTDAHLGILHVLWLGCHEGTHPCFSSGLAHNSSTGSILIRAEFHLGLGHRGTELKVPAVLVLVPAGYKIKCNIIGENDIPITGSVIGEIVPSAGLDKQSAKVNVFFRQTAGIQDMTLFLLSKLTNEEVMTGQILESELPLFGKQQSGEQADAELTNPNGETLEIKQK